MHPHYSKAQSDLAIRILESTGAKYTTEHREQAAKIVSADLGVDREPKRMTGDEIDAMRFAINFLRDYGKYPSTRGYQADYRSATSADKLTRIKHADALATFIGEFSFGQSAENWKPGHQ